MVDIGKIIVLAISLSIVGSLLTSSIFNYFAGGGCAGCAVNHTGLLAVIMPFVPILFGVGILYVAIREMGLGKK